MTLDKKLALGGASNYESPLVTALDIRSEGVLCGSTFDENHHTEAFDRDIMEEL